MSNPDIQLLCKKIDELRDEFREEKEVNKQYREEIEPILELIRGANTARSIVLWFTSVILAVGAVTLMIKSLIK